MYKLHNLIQIKWNKYIIRVILKFVKYRVIHIKPV